MRYFHCMGNQVESVSKRQCLSKISRSKRLSLVPHFSPKLQWAAEITSETMIFILLKRLKTL